jgi:hypothetical protein
MPMTSAKNALSASSSPSSSTSRLRPHIPYHPPIPLHARVSTRSDHSKSPLVGSPISTSRSTSLPSGSRSN